MMCAGLMVGLVATYIFFFITDTPATTSENETLLDRNNEQNTLSFLRAWELPGVALCAFSYGGVKMVNHSFLMWLPYYLALEHNFPLELVSVFTTLYDLGGILASVLSGVLTKATESKTIIVLAMLGCSVPTLICFKMMNAIWMLYIIVPVLGLLLAGTGNIISASITADLASSSGRNGSRATIVGLINGTGSLGAAFGQIFVRVI